MVPRKIAFLLLHSTAAAVAMVPSTSLQSQPLFLLLPLLLPSSNTPFLFAEAAPTSSYEERRERRERRQREREEREKEKLYWKEQYGYEHVGNEDGEASDQGDESKASPFGTSTSITSLFATQKPRDAIDGIRSLLSNALRGSFYGITALFVSPIGGLKYGAGGALVGLITGVLLGVTMPLAGFVVGAYQMLRGLAATPEAIVDGFVNCKIYDETSRSWVEYRLEEDLKEIERALEEEKKESKGGGGRSNGRDSSSSQQQRRRKVKNTEYYDLLDISPDASSSSIRSAYRKKAREVHPDKNPNDPEAERRFRELSAAYQTLSDPTKRARYDSSGVGIDPEQPEGADGGSVMLDPIVFFAVLFGSEKVEPYIGELGMATTFDALLKLGTAASAQQTSFNSWDDIKQAFGWSDAALKRRKRETDIALYLRERVSDYVEGYLTLGAFKDGCWEEAVGIAKGGSYGASFLLAIGPALVAEADAFLGYRASVLGSWRGPMSNAKRNLLFLRRKFAVGKAVLRTVKESLKALYDSAQVVPKNDDEELNHHRRPERLDNNERSRRKRDRVVFDDKELLKDNLSNTIPSILDMAWAINFVDISNTLYGACGKLFHDADVASWEDRLRRAEAVHILGSQFYLVGLEVTGGNTTLTGDIDDIKAQANAAFMESLKSKMQSNNDEM